MSNELLYEVGSGNVFADLGLPGAEELKAKSELVLEIIQVIEDRGLKQVEAATLRVTRRSARTRTRRDRKV